MENSNRVLLFGSTGAIGSAVLAAFERHQWSVLRVSRSSESKQDFSTADPDWMAGLEASGQTFHAVIWAQGMNLENRVFDFEPEAHQEVLEANLNYILHTMSRLLNSRVLAPETRFTIVGSIWSSLSRPGKLSYMISKAGVSALVRSAAVDLASRGIAVNSVSPGVVDSPMARNFLSEEAFLFVARNSNGGRMPTLEEVAEVVVWLSGSQASGISGQEIIVDRGWGVSKSVEP